MPPAMLWRRLDHEGHDAARLLGRPSAWLLAGTAVFVYDGKPCRLDYRVTCDLAWNTLGATVEGWLGDSVVDASIDVDPERRWWLNGVEYPAVQGCIDLDLSFSPATNLLPLRRLELAVGAAADVQAAWLRFPELTLEPLPQHYRRSGDNSYHYESGAGEFVAELTVGATGFIISYPGLWQAVDALGDAAGERAVGGLAG